MNEPTKAANPKDAIAAGKIPLGLCSPIAAAHWALAQHAGMCKYGGWNWRLSGVRASVYIHAIGRHLAAFTAGEETDPVDGTHHLGNIMACCAIILDAAEAGMLTDDRPPVVGIRATYAKLEALASKLQAQYADKTPRHCTIADVVIPMAPRVPSNLGPFVRTVVAGEGHPSSQTEPSGPLCSVPIASSDPDADPPESEEDVDSPIPFQLVTKKDPAPSTQRSSGVQEKERIRVEPGKPFAVTQRIQSSGGLESIRLTSHFEDSVAAFERFWEWFEAANPGETVAMYRDGTLFFERKKGAA